MVSNPELLNIDWLNEPTYREVISKERLLKDIKTNLISLLNDYKGRDIENEDRLIDEVNKMFTGGVVPSLVDWKILNLVLQELSEVKEQGAMYRYFIRDVSDSLGVNDLKKIRNFIEYITTLAPVNPSLSMTVDGFGEYKIEDFHAKFLHNIEEPNEQNEATLHWNVKEPESTPYARIKLEDSRSEDVSLYNINFTAGSYSKNYTITAQQISKNQNISPGVLISNRTAFINVPVLYEKWFPSTASNLYFRVSVETKDKRGNISRTSDYVSYPSGEGIPQGYSQFELFYKPSPNRNWQKLIPKLTGDKRKSYSIDMTDIDGYHQFGIVGYDEGLKSSSNPEGKQEMVLSPKYRLTFRGDPPGRPSPVITKVTYNRVDFKWAPTENTDYYTIKFRNDKTGFVRDDHRVEQSSNPSQWFQPGISPDAGHRIFVTAHNKWYPDGLTGTVYVNTPKAPIQTTTYRATGSKRYIGQKYYGDRKGYRRGTGPTVYNTGNKNRGLYWEYGEKSMPQAHWREMAPHGWVWRSGGAYQAHYGQSHGNNLSLFEFDYDKIRKDMKDKEIVSVEIRVKRAGSQHGWKNIGRPLYLYNYSRDSVNAVYDQNGREVTYNNNNATFNFNFKRGAVRTANNTNSKKLFENIVNNNMKGLALFHYDTAWFNSKPPIANEKYLRLLTNDTQFTVKYRNT